MRHKCTVVSVIIVAFVIAVAKYVVFLISTLVLVISVATVVTCHCL